MSSDKILLPKVTGGIGCHRTSSYDSAPFGGGLLRFGHAENYSASYFHPFLLRSAATVIRIPPLIAPFVTEIIGIGMDGRADGRAELEGRFTITAHGT